MQYAHDFQEMLHPIIDKICIPLLIINHDDTAPELVRSNSSDYLERLHEILESSTETLNHAKMHAWNVLSWMIDDYSEMMPLMPLQDANHSRLKHVMYLLAKEFDYQELPKQVLDALEKNEEKYISDLQSHDDVTYQRLILS